MNIEDVKIRLGDFKKLPGIGKKTVADAKRYVQDNPDEFGLELDSQEETPEKELLSGAIDIGMKENITGGIAVAIDKIKKYISKHSSYSDEVNRQIMLEAIKYPQFRYDVHKAWQSIWEDARSEIKGLDYLDMSEDALRAKARTLVEESLHEHEPHGDELNFERFQYMIDKLEETSVGVFLTEKKHHDENDDSDIENDDSDIENDGPKWVPGGGGDEFKPEDVEKMIESGLEEDEIMEITGKSVSFVKNVARGMEIEDELENEFDILG